MRKKYYSLEEIKANFQSYRDIRESTITDEEYDIFCDQVQVLPKEVVDRVKAEIKFVFLSADPKNVNPACYINLSKNIGKEKKGIIILTPFIFGAPFLGKDGKEKRIFNVELPCVLHEVAHHILGHHVYKDERDYEEKEKTAWKQVEEWIKQWTNFKDNEYKE